MKVHERAPMLLMLLQITMLFELREFREEFSVNVFVESPTLRLCA